MVEVKISIPHIDAKYKDCSMKPINRDYIDDIVINQLSKNIFSPKSIEKLTKELTKCYNKSLQNNKSEIKDIDKQLMQINKEIDNLITALASGISSLSIKDKLNSLEEKKIHLSTVKTELQCSLDSKILDENLIKQYLLKDASLLKNKSANDIKNIINTYVESVLVYDEKVEVNLLMVHINGGGEGSCASIISIWH